LNILREHKRRHKNINNDKRRLGLKQEIAYSTKFE
jgi:hypothetical protein